MLRSELVLVGFTLLANIACISCDGNVVFIDKNYYRGSLCELSDGSDGICDSHCILSGSDIERNTVCSYEGFDQLVCCKTVDGHAFYPILERVCQEQIEAAREEQKLKGKNKEGIKDTHIAVLGLVTPDGTEWNCEGSLIHPNYVLTSANCIVGKKNPPERVHVGPIDLSKDGGLDNAADYDITKIFVHSRYRPSKPYNDIAILHVKKTNVNENIAPPRPACIWTKRELPSSELQTVSYQAADLGNSLSNLTLYQINASVLEAEECKKHFSADKTLPLGILESQICAVDTEKKLGICQDNFGSLMQFNDPQAEGQLYLVGIGSFGKSCQDGANLVYTRLYSFLGWIESVLQRSESGAMVKQKN